MIIYYVMTVMITLVILIISITKGSCIALLAVNKNNNPILIILITIQVFNLIMVLISANLVVFNIIIILIQLGTLAYLIKFVPNGVYKNAIIINGISYDLNQLKGYTIEGSKIVMNIGSYYKNCVVDINDVGKVKEHFDNIMNQSIDSN